MNHSKSTFFSQFIVVVLVVIGIFVVLAFARFGWSPTAKYDDRLTEIMSDDKEIERKWLINKDKIPYDLNASSVHQVDIKQTYLCFNPEMRVRDYDNGDHYEFTVKDHLTSDGMVRDEVNLDIDKEQYDNLFQKREDAITIHKTRYQFYAEKQLIAIDIFHDDLDGLAYMEIEFASEEESNAFQTPDWTIKDVTADIRYKNGHLARYGIPDPQ